MSVSAITKLIKSAIKNETQVSLTRKGDAEGRSFIGKLALVEPNENGEERYAIRTGKPGRPVVVTVAEVDTLVKIAA